MIRQTLPEIKKATFVVQIHDKNNDGFPTPIGTGYFISPNGYFLTANHVVEDLQIGEKVDLVRPDTPVHAILLDVEIIKKWKNFDLALLKANFEFNKERIHFKDLKHFPYIEIDFSNQDEGTPIYAFGYPLMSHSIKKENGVSIGTIDIPPRATSAIISSTIESFKPVRTSNDPLFYVIDKALNYGNSGGPIILSESGKVFATCVRFQPVIINGIVIPSLYGIVSSLKNIESDLKRYLNS